MERGIPSFADALTMAGKRRALTICSQQAKRTLLRAAEMHTQVLSGDICAPATAPRRLKISVIEVRRTLGDSHRFRTFDPFSVLNRATAPLRSKPTVKR